MRRRVPRGAGQLCPKRSADETDAAICAVYRWICGFSGVRLELEGTRTLDRCACIFFGKGLHMETELSIMDIKYLQCKLRKEEMGCSFPKARIMRCMP